MIPTRHPPPAIASQLVPESGVQDGDIVIVKRQWGAFYGTGLDQQLRRRGIRTIMIGGIATNIGVESTAREAFDRGYEMVFVEDAMSTISPEAPHLCRHNYLSENGSRPDRRTTTRSPHPKETDESNG